MLIRQDWRHLGDSEQPAIDVVGELLTGRLSEDKLLPDWAGRGIHIERHVEHRLTAAKRKRRPKRRGRTAALMWIGRQRPAQVDASECGAHTPPIERPEVAMW